MKKFDIMEKNCPQISFFFSGRGDSDQKLPEKSDKNGPDALREVSFINEINNMA